MTIRRDTEFVPKNPESSFFPYIDGIRALSIAVVVLFHLEPRLLPGGFAGVDMFFVISGFIVSGSLHRCDVSNFVGLVALFYSRRFRRIVPALLLMLVLTGIAVVLFIPDAFLSGHIRASGLTAFFGVSNFQLARTGYFSPHAEFNPFTHTWSLAVEEQFYLIFPVLLFLLRRNGVVDRNATFALLALCGLSFAFSVVEPSLSIRLGFYSSLGRFWEIGAGMLLYAYLARTGRFESRPQPLPEMPASTYLGSALVVAGLIAGGSQSYPVPGALLPVFGALLLIFGLHGRTPSSIVGRALSCRPAVWIGAISYSLYLWHWPVFVLFRWTVGFSTPVQKLAALAIAVALSVVSYYWVERPFRTRGLRNPLRAIAVCVLLILSCAGAMQMIYARSMQLSLSTVAMNYKDWYSPEPGEFKDGHGCRIEHLEKRLDIVRVFVISRTGCDLPNPTARLFVIGDSHAYAYSSLFYAYSLRTGVRVSVYEMLGCSVVRLAPGGSECARPVDLMIDDVRKDLAAGDVVFLPSLRVPRFRDQWHETVLDTDAAFSVMRQHRDAALVDALAMLGRLSVPGVSVVFEMPKPIFKTPLFRCSDWFNRHNPVCSSGFELERAFLEQYRQPVTEFARTLQDKVAGFSTWDPLPLLCRGEVCPMFRDGKPLYFDADHVSAFANRLLLDDFAARMKEEGLPER